MAVSVRGPLIATALLALPLVVGEASAQVVQFQSGDPEMNRAIARARKALPDFVALYRVGKGERHSVKVAIPHAEGREHIWMRLTGIDGETFTGTISNRPVHLEGIQMGSPYRAGREMISDWSYYEGGRMHGGYTPRVALKKLAPQQVRELGLNLAPLPR